MQKSLPGSGLGCVQGSLHTIGLVALLMAGLGGSFCQAATRGPADSLVGTLGTDWGSSSRHARQRAEAALPLEQMAAADRRAIEASLQSTTLYRRLPVELFSCDGDLLSFGLEKPETIVDIWRLLGISRLSLDPVGPEQWRLADGYGTVGLLRLAHRERRADGGVLIFHGRGAYTGPLSPKNLTGNCVLMVRYREAEPMTDGRQRQAVQIDAFLDMDGIGLEIVTRTLQPLIARSAAANLHEICLFMASLSDAAMSNPEGVATLAGRLQHTTAADRQALASIARRAAGRRGNPKETTPPATMKPADNERLTVDLAARWLPSAELTPAQRQ
jgi:hypothetical protein